MFITARKLLQRLYFYTCLSFCSQGGVCLSACWDTHTPPLPREQIPPPRSRYPPEQTPPGADPPGADNPPGVDTPPKQTSPPAHNFQVDYRKWNRCRFSLSGSLSVMCTYHKSSSFLPRLVSAPMYSCPGISFLGKSHNRTDNGDIFGLKQKQRRKSRLDWHTNYFLSALCAVKCTKIFLLPISVFFVLTTQNQTGKVLIIPWLNECSRKPHSTLLTTFVFFLPMPYLQLSP